MRSEHNISMSVQTRSKDVSKTTILLSACHRSRWVQLTANLSLNVGKTLLKFEAIQVVTD